MATAVETQHPEVEVAVRRLDGSRAVQKIQKRTYYMVNIWHEGADEDDCYLREVVVAEDTAPKAKAFVKRHLLEDGEEVESAMKTDFRDAAVLKLRGWTIHNA